MMPLSKIDLFNQPPLEPAKEARNAILKVVQDNAGQEFIHRAKAFVVAYLRQHGDTSGELLTDKCKEAGIVPVNGDRAFGPVYAALKRHGIIFKVASCKRTKGHATDGGSVYGLDPIAEAGQDVVQLLHGSKSVTSRG